MSQPRVLEGTWEEIKLHEPELAGKRFRLTPVPPAPNETVAIARKPKRSSTQQSQPEPRQLTGMGKFAGIIPSSEEFIREKQEEIELEERKLRR